MVDLVYLGWNIVVKYFKLVREIYSFFLFRPKRCETNFSKPHRRRGPLQLKLIPPPWNRGQARFSRPLCVDGIRGSSRRSPVPRGLFSAPINGDDLFFIFPRVMRYRVRAWSFARAKAGTTAGIALPLCHSCKPTPRLPISPPPPTGVINFPRATPYRFPCLPSTLHHPPLLNLNLCSFPRV